MKIRVKNGKLRPNNDWNFLKIRAIIESFANPGITISFNSLAGDSRYRPELKIIMTVYPIDELPPFHEIESFSSFFNRLNERQRLYKTIKTLLVISLSRYPSIDW